MQRLTRRTPNLPEDIRAETALGALKRLKAAGFSEAWCARRLPVGPRVEDRACDADVHGGPVCRCSVSSKDDDAAKFVLKVARSRRPALTVWPNPSAYRSDAPAREPTHRPYRALTRACMYAYAAWARGVANRAQGPEHVSGLVGRDGP